MSVTIDDIRAAAERLRGQVLRSPSIRSDYLSRLTGADIFLKLENLQPTGSFKVRGALEKLLSLSDAERRAGVIAQSAGNHAQGVAYHAQRLGIPATVVMPRDTPFTKFLRTERLGAHVVQVGANLSEAWQTAMDVAEKENLTFVHPYDDPRIVAGQGTIGLELAEDCPDLDAVIVPVGGGGLISGIAIAMKALIPEIEVVGAEAARFALMSAATGLAPQISGRDTVADGIAVAEVGSIAKDVVKRLVSDMLRVDEDDIETAMQILVSEQNIVAEGAGAVPLAAVLDEPNRFRGRKVALIVSGGNVDSRLLASILMRSLVRQGRLTRLRVETSDAPGELSDVSEIIGRTGGNIVEVEHQRLFYDVPVKSAEIDFVIETRDTEHVAEIVAALEGAGFPTQLLSNKGHDEKN